MIQTLIYNTRKLLLNKNPVFNELKTKGSIFLQNKFETPHSMSLANLNEIQGSPVARDPRWGSDPLHESCKGSDPLHESCKGSDPLHESCKGSHVSRLWREDPLHESCKDSKQIVDKAFQVVLKQFKHEIDYIFRLNGISNNLRLYGKKWDGAINLHELISCVYLKDCEWESIQEFPERIRNVVKDIQTQGVSKEAKIIHLADVLDELNDDIEGYTVDEKKALYAKYVALFNQPDDEATQLLRHHISQILGSFQFDMDETKKSELLQDDHVSRPWREDSQRGSEPLQDSQRGSEPLQDSCNGSDLSDACPKLISHDHEPEPHHGPNKRDDWLVQWQNLPEDMRQTLDKDEVFCIMQQAECNDIHLAIEALRKHGNIVDAILEIVL